MHLDPQRRRRVQAVELDGRAERAARGARQWIVTNRKGETLTILIEEILLDSTHDLGDDPGLQKDGVEARLQELLALDCEAIGAGLRLVRREHPTDIGPVDLLCRDADGRAVAVEVKRRGEIDGVEQLTRYLERLNRDPMLRPVRGILVAQVVKPQAGCWPRAAASAGSRSTTTSCAASNPTRCASSDQVGLVRPSIRQREEGGARPRGRRDLGARTARRRPTSVPGAPSCPMFPADSVWHADVSGLPVHPMSNQYVASIGSTAQAKADFGSGLWDGGPIGIPYNVVGAGQPTSTVTFDYDDESDHVPYPIPANPSIEGGPNSSGDRHVLIVDNSSCTLYELYAAYPNGNGTWHAGSGAVWNLNSNALRPDTWTSGDAAGLPILPGLVRYDEVASGHIDHAIRVTVPSSDRNHLWPARHDAGSANSNLPPMGLRLRLKAQFDVSPYPHDDQVILQAMKTYGVIVADNGSPWFMSGVPDERWNNDVLQQLRTVHGSDFEAVGRPVADGRRPSVRRGTRAPRPPPAPPPLGAAGGDIRRAERTVSARSRHAPATMRNRRGARGRTSAGARPARAKEERRRTGAGGPGRATRPRRRERASARLPKAPSTGRGALDPAGGSPATASASRLRRGLTRPARHGTGP